MYVSNSPKQVDVKDNSVYLTTGTLGRGKAMGFAG
jgi:hypothetical protein